ncbi:MAG: class II aldolase/adducin family protein [Candidatus Sericytochromatia bacterium]
MEKTRIKKALVTTGRHLHKQGLLAAGDGNLSYRTSDQSIFITPRSQNKARLSAEEIAEIDLENTIHLGQPSSERLMHLAIYRHIPSAKAIVHAHPPTAIAWSLARPDWSELPTESLPEIILAAGRIPIVPYTRPGTQAMGDILLPFLPSCRILILARHGAVCWGESLEEAADGIERVEQVCLILKLAYELGGATPLPMSEVKALLALRAQLGPRIL